MKCETSETACMAEAVHCATLTDADGIVIAHKALCEMHALSLFAVRVNFADRLRERVRDVVRAQQMADIE